MRNSMRSKFFKIKDMHMKQILKICLAVIFTGFMINAKAQSNAPQQVAHKIAKKMKDSLDLTSQQRHQVFQVNMQLHNEKTAVRSQYAGADSLGYYIQQVENKRDSLYLPVLGPDKYQLYLQKKRNLVNNN